MIIQTSHFITKSWYIFNIISNNMVSKLFEGFFILLEERIVFLQLTLTCEFLNKRVVFIILKIQVTDLKTSLLRPGIT